MVCSIGCLCCHRYVFTCRSWQVKQLHLLLKAVTSPSLLSCSGDVDSDLLHITGGLLQGHTSKKKQNVITCLQIFM